MVLGIILYETVDVLYAVSKITINSVKYIYDWYNADEDDEIFVKIDKHGNIIDDSENSEDNENNENIKYIKKLHYDPELIYIKKIEELERKINELNEKINNNTRNAENTKDETNQNNEKITIKVNLKEKKEK